MGQADIVQKQFFEDNERFADLLNGVLFGGRTVIHPEDLLEKNPATSAVPAKKRSSRSISVEKYRDIIRKVFFGVNFCLIGVENQTKVHYAMPARTMLMDALGYEEQLRKHRRQQRGKTTKSEAEYLSGFPKEALLHPVCTLTIYYGEEPWDGAKNLREVLDLANVPECLITYFSDYPLHLVDVHRLPDLEYFHTDLREVFGLIQNAGNGQRLITYVEEHKTAFENMREDAFSFALEATNSPELKQMKEKIKTKEGRCDMCKGIRELMQGSKEEGRTEGISIGQAQMEYLVSRLLQENKIDELKRAMADASYREKLMESCPMQ